MSASLRVMLVDDHAMVRMGFRMLLSSTDDIEVVGEAEDGESAYLRFAELRPQVVVMDLSMPGMGGIESLRRLVARDPDVRVLVLSAHEDTAHPRRALNAGAMGYVSKRGAPEELIDAVRAVAAGRVYLGIGLSRKLASQDSRGGSPVERLSEREFAVFLQLARGQSVAQIAETLHLSANTVGTHLYNIKQKLEVSNQAELTLIALRHGLLEI